MDELAAPRRDETPAERTDRNLNELLGEVRVGLPGVQVLFGFLLIVPFSARFGDVTAFQKDVYLATLVCIALSSVLMIAPSMLHRLEFHHGDKAYVVGVSNKLTIAGLTLLAVGMVGVMILVADFLFGVVATVVTAAGLTIAVAWLWYLMPLRRLRKIERR